MPEPTIPIAQPVDGLTLIDALEQRIAALELKEDAARLSDEFAHRSLLISEVRQRILMRYAAFSLSLTTMVFMGFVLLHAMHQFVWKGFLSVTSSVAIAFFVAPTISYGFRLIRPETVFRPSKIWPSGQRFSLVLVSGSRSDQPETVSISAITIMLLIGAFRRFRDDDMDNIHLPSIAAEAAKSSLSN